ncbi:MAG: hypothetical protein AAGK17_05365 [Pseudomonadota bacterium]
MSVIVIPRRTAPLSAFSTDGDMMINPKWLVFGVLLSAFVLLANYDLQLGLAAGSILGIVLAIYAWVQYRLWLADHEPGDTRRAMINRMRKLTENRRRARNKELSGES